MADLVCSVYYDNFANTVARLTPNVGLFTKNEFIKEFENR